MKNKTKKLLLGSGILAAGFGIITALSYKLTEKFVGIAMDREEPEIMRKNKSKLTGSNKTAKLMGTDIIAELIERMDTAEERLLASNLETVEIESDDGLKLVGHWYGSNNPKRVIVAMHGWRSSWTKDFGIISQFWEDNDCAVLYAEQRAQGNSEGEYMTFGLMERYDCLAWTKWAETKTNGKLPIYLCGLSMGATTILMTAGLELPDSVKGIIADCGFTSPHAIWKHVANNNIHIPYSGFASMLANQLSKQKANLNPKEYSTVDAMGVCKVPVMFIHGTDDHFVPVSMTYENYNACVSEKKLLVVPGAEHGMSYIVDELTYKKAVIDFWNEHDC